MNTDGYFERARLLISQGRRKDAIEPLRHVLAAAPNDGLAHAWLGYCLVEDRDRIDEATREVEQGVHLAPDDPVVYQLLAVVRIARNETDQAMEAIDQAIRLDPTAASAYATKSLLLSDQERWDAMLETSETGLQFDPEDEQLLAYRAFALERLGRIEDSLRQADEAVARAPDSADAHASRGWALLQQGKVREAQEAFREALRLDPNDAFARQGMIQAINGRNPIYRFFYAIMTKLSRLESQTRWFLVVALWLVIQGLSRLSQNWPEFTPWVLPLTAFYLLFVMMSWIMTPLFNALLRFHPFGKYLLSRSEKIASNLIVGTLASGVVFGVAAAVNNQLAFLGILPILGSLYLCIPISVLFRVSARWAWVVALLVAIGFTLLYLANSSLEVAGYVSLTLTQIYGIGILIYSFAGQWLVQVQPEYRG